MGPDCCPSCDLSTAIPGSKLEVLRQPDPMGMGIERLTVDVDLDGKNVAHATGSYSEGFFLVGMVWVSSEYRGRGVASRMLNCLRERTGLPVLPLAVEHNRRAVEFWAEWLHRQSGVPLARARRYALAFQDTDPVTHGNPKWLPAEQLAPLLK